MPPTYNSHDDNNNNLSDFLIKYINIKFYDGYIYGFITGVSSTIILFSMFHKCNSGRIIMV
jgi:hypothetical protein